MYNKKLAMEVKNMYILITCTNEQKTNYDVFRVEAVGVFVEGKHVTWIVEIYAFCW